MQARPSSAPHSKCAKTLLLAVPWMRDRVATQQLPLNDLSLSILTSHDLDMVLLSSK